MFGLARLTAPELEAAAGPTTTERALEQPTTTTQPPDPADFRIRDIRTGKQLLWVQGYPPGQMAPFRIVELGGEYLMFGFGEPRWFGNPVHLWHSADSVFWTDEGEVIPAELQVENIFEIDEGLLAPSREGLLRSADGRTWDLETLPPPREMQPGERVRFAVAAAGAGRSVVLGEIHSDEVTVLEEYLPEAERNALRLGYGWNLESSARMTIQGPWGLPVQTIDLESLGIPPELMRAIRFGFTPELHVWVKDGDSEWSVTQLEGQWAESAHVRPDGTILVTGYGLSGPSQWMSEDGVLWDRQTRPVWTEPVVAWDGGFVGPVSGQADMAYSTDGLSWEQANLDARFPSAIDWGVWPTVAGEGGVAAFIDSHMGNRAWIRPNVIVERGDWRLSADHRTGFVELENVADETVELRAQMWSGQMNPRVRADIVERTYAFLDEAGNEPLVTFGFDEMEEAEQAAYAEQGFGPDLQGLFFTEDGTEWSIQDLEGVFDGESVATAYVAGDRVIAATVSGYWGRQLPGVTIHIGLIPPQ